MNQSTSAEVEGYLEQYGWSYRKNGKGVYLSGWVSDKRAYPLRVIVEDNFTTLAVQPFVKTEVDILAFPEVSAHLLELNYHSYMVKVSIDDSGDVALSITLLNEAIDFDQFSSCISILGHYADQVYEEIELAFNTDIHSQNL